MYFSSYLQCFLLFQGFPLIGGVDVGQSRDPPLNISVLLNSTPLLLRNYFHLKKIRIYAL